MPTLKINGQPASGRPPGNGEPGGYAQWLNDLVSGNTTGFNWAEINVEAQGAASTEVSRRRGYLPLPVAYSSIYDLDGNLTEDVWGFYTWDAENRLSSAEMRHNVLPPELPAKRLEFLYDAQGRRVLKRLLVRTCPRVGGGSSGTPLSYGPRETTWRLSTETRFWYDGWNLMAETVKAASSTSSQVHRRYLWGLDLSGTEQGAGGVGGLLCVMANLPALHGGGTQASFGEAEFRSYSAASDVNGNIMGLIDPATGTLQARWDYDPFGNTVTDWYATGNPAHSLNNPFRFSSKYLDEETGWYYFGFRYMHQRGQGTNLDKTMEI